MRRGNTVIVEIEKLDSTGKGVAKPGGFVVFVPGGMPGQKVKVRIEKKKRNYAEGNIVEVLEKSSMEGESLCSAFPKCGGCAWQTLPYEEQVRTKEELVRESLVHLGKLKIKVLPIIRSPEQTFYRNKMEFSFGLDENGQPVLGMHERGFFSRVVEIKDCILMSKESNRIISFFKDFAREFNLDVYDPKIHQGLLRHLIIREGKTTGERMVNLVTTSSNLIGWIDELTHKFMLFSQKEEIKVNSFLHTINDKVSDIAVGDRTNLLRGRDYITERVKNVLFRISPYSFFQTNTLATELLYQKVREFAKVDKKETVLDLYCGTGGLGLFIADSALRIIGIDSFPQAIEDAQENAGLNEITNAGFQVDKVKDFLSRMVGRKEIFDVVIADPPREGLNPKIIKGISIIRPKRIVYVSCNPATMTRDLQILDRCQYKTGEVQPIDLFPHTPHIECVTVLEDGVRS